MESHGFPLGFQRDHIDFLWKLDRVCFMTGDDISPTDNRF